MAGFVSRLEIKYVKFCIFKTNYIIEYSLLCFSVLSSDVMHTWYWLLSSFTLFLFQNGALYLYVSSHFHFQCFELRQQ